MFCAQGGGHLAAVLWVNTFSIEEGPFRINASGNRLPMARSEKGLSYASMALQLRIQRQVALQFRKCEIRRFKCEHAAGIADRFSHAQSMCTNICSDIHGDITRAKKFAKRRRGGSLKCPQQIDGKVDSLAQIKFPPKPTSPSSNQAAVSAQSPERNDHPGGQCCQLDLFLSRNDHLVPPRLSPAR